MLFLSQLTRPAHLSVITHYFNDLLKAVVTFRPVSRHAVHRVCSDTADSPDTPTHSRALHVLQSRRWHALITRPFAHHWSSGHTCSFFIGSMLPPASLLWILFFYFFPPWLVLLSWDKSWVVKANWIPVSVVTNTGVSSSDSFVLLSEKCFLKIYINIYTHAF